MRRTDENSCRYTSAHHDTKNSGLSGAALSRPAPGARYLRFHRPYGLVLIVAVNNGAASVCFLHAEFCIESSAPPRHFVLDSSGPSQECCLKSSASGLLDPS